MNVTETKLTLKNLPPRESVLIQGAHGIGKSEVVAQTAQELSVEDSVPVQLIDLRLSQKEVGDLIGMPRGVEKYTGEILVWENGKLRKKTVHGENVTVYNPPSWYPTDPNSHGILFLDELNRATREVQQAAFELVLDYRLNFQPLPQGWRVVAAINEDSDIYSVLEMDPALLDRFQVIPFKPTVEEWMKHAKSINSHNAVIEYITKFPTSLDTPEKVEPGKVYPSRRAWVKLSNTMNYMKGRNLDLLAAEQAQYLIKLAGGYVGPTSAVHFEDFIRKDYKVLSPQDILNKFDGKLADALSKMKAPEVAYYNGELIGYIKKHELSKKQNQNLFRYFQSIPKETAADFWQFFLREAKPQATKWWNSIPEVSDQLLKILGRKESLS